MNKTTLIDDTIKLHGKCMMRIESPALMLTLLVEIAIATELRRCTSNFSLSDTRYALHPTQHLHHRMLCRSHLFVLSSVGMPYLTFPSRTTLWVSPPVFLFF